MEMLRIQVFRNSIANYFAILARILGVIPACFVWNMDEVVHADWRHAHANTAYVTLIAVPT
jgi:hypothetical protein